ncbi:MAG: AMP-binding protein [Alphaproteobacteria bacterium]
MIDIMGVTPDCLTLRDLVIKRAQQYGDKPLLICRDETLTYADADRLSNRVANGLLARGIAHGDVVATFMYNSIAQEVIWFACAKIGAIYASLNVSLAKGDLAYSLNDTGAKFLIVDDELAEVYLSARSEVTLNPEVMVHGVEEGIPGAGRYDELLKGAETLPDADVRGTDPVCIVYTGGSTSMPKGVLASNLYYIAAAIRYQEIAQATDADVHYANSHFFHIGGQQFGVTGPLYVGMTGIMHKWFSASNYWAVARKYGATIIDPLGTMMSVLLLAEPSEQDRNHKVRVGIGIAASQVRKDLRDEFETRFGAPMLEVYSMTEMGVLLCSERLDDRLDGSCGHPHGWAEVKIVDDEDNPLPTGETGQILLRPTVLNTYMIEYINKPKETLAAWKNLWYHSGDLGYVDEKGYVYFVGREAHWIRRRGENVSAFEVEKALTAHPSVQDCGVVGVPSELGEEDIKAYVELVAGAEAPDPGDLIAWCADRIAYFKTPRYIQYVDTFPRTMTKNEIARHELRAIGVGQGWDKDTGAWINSSAD